MLAIIIIREIAGIRHRFHGIGEQRHGDALLADSTRSGTGRSGSVAGMEVVFAASEAVPFSKTGGLADVAGALPKAVERLGHKVSLFVPSYRQTHKSGVTLSDTGVALEVPVGSRMISGRVLAARLPGSTVSAYLIDQPAFFDRDGIYGTGEGEFSDNCERFVFFNRAVLEAIEPLGLKPDVIHCNDWQTGLIPLYLKSLYRDRPALRSTGSMFTIHNLAYLGLFWSTDILFTGLDWSYFHWQRLEYHGRLSLMKAGLIYADLLTTVSPTYAREIQTTRFGSGLDGLLRERQAELRGIVNGIDPAVWSPRHEPMLVEPYDADSVSTGKPLCKAWLQNRAGLPERPDIPLFAQIGRLDPQKGWDLLAEIAERLLALDVQVVVLGVGQRKYHELLDHLARRHSSRFRAFLDFSDDLAHQIEAGADLFLMPSLFEPCGLNQLYSLAHGTVPIVHSVGGLADTVVDTNPETMASQTATGFLFHDPNPDALWNAIERALSLWQDRPAWHSVMTNGMTADWSWNRSAAEYAQAYAEIRAKCTLEPSSL